MTLDKQQTLSPPSEHPPAANKKTKRWASVRRKFSLIVTNRNTSSPTPETTQTAESQAESFCRPFVRDIPEGNPSERNSSERSPSERSPSERNAPESNPSERKAPEKIGLEKYAPERPSTPEPEPEPESEWDIEIARITRENSERNNNLDIYSSETTKPPKNRRRSKKKKHDKSVRFNEEPDIIPDHEGAELQHTDTESVSEESDDEPKLLERRDTGRRVLPVGLRLVHDD